MDAFLRSEPGMNIRIVGNPALLRTTAPFLRCLTGGCLRRAFRASLSLDVKPMYCV